MSKSTPEFWIEDTKHPTTCSCGGRPRVMPPNERDKYQVQCLACLSRGPVSCKKAAAINEWNMQVEALTTRRNIYEIIRNRIEIAKAKVEAANV